MNAYSFKFNLISSSKYLFNELFAIVHLFYIFKCRLRMVPLLEELI